MAKKSLNKKVVLASGVFDLLHLGHVRFLEEAKKVGGKNSQLIVIIARDITVKEKKGRKPVMSENQRRALVESLKVVDEAVLGFEDFDIGDVIERVKPDIIALGYDQTELENGTKMYVNNNRLTIKVVRIGKFEEDELDSSSKIKKKIIQKFIR
jgi:FAD synthetase